MDRKKFIQTAGLGLSLTLVPQIARGENHTKKKEVNGKLHPKIVRNSEGDVLNVIGDIQTHKLIGNDTNNQIVEWVDDVEPGVGIPPHVHTMEDEIFRVIKGEIEIMVDKKITILRAGDTAFAPRKIPHSWRVVGGEKAKMITSALPAGIEMMFRELAELPPGPPDFDKVKSICEDHGISFL